MDGEFIDQELIVRVGSLDGDFAEFGKPRGARRMIQMCVGEQNLIELQLATLDLSHDALHFSTRIYDRGPKAFYLPNDGAVLVKRGHRKNKRLHPPYPNRLG
jgi:hypothetical protein